MAKKNLSAATIDDLHKELTKRAGSVKKLEAKRDKLIEQVDELNREISAAGGAIRAARLAVGRKRPRNEKNLIESLADVLRGVTMSVTEVTEAVQAAGYMTTSSTFRTIVNQTLINSGRFKRVSRGRYTTKGGGTGKKKSTSKKASRKKSARKKTRTRR